MRTAFGSMTSLVSVSALSLFALLPACASAPDAADAADDTSEEGSELSTNANSGYFVVTHPDFRRCASPMCGGYFVKRVNAGKTRCLDGAYRAECYVASIDTAGLGLAATEASTFDDQLSSGQALVRATLAHDVTPGGDFGKLVVAEGWLGRSLSVPTGTFYRLTPSGVRCIGAPCPSYAEGKLNSAKKGTVDDLDLSSTPKKATRATIDDAFGQVATPAGILVAGEHASFRAPLGTGTKLVASEFYTRVVAAPVKQGCGGFRPGPGCPKGTYCAMPMSAMCGAADQGGYCEPRPQLCNEIYAPVCACDGKTYSNACAANAAGASISSEGPCAPPPPPPPQGCGSRGMSACPSGEYCSFPTGSQCGALDKGGSCASKPAVCNFIFAPVCGCDGKTYSNACLASSAGVSVAASGACN